ncbi:GNAT family N-acetyltransferase [Alkalicoccobacillus plakortidis]|uniref:GNAT family N-acetyltransferase n=1 Tax=Alkalicoccobacillus plakortidis TaxID=444060 RepID=A0ABT0XFM5_9BACI|nr:GNAT family N-acetyltransferase [Alkalicoccobacillus plakortidis]MCM2674158.1 GNAT family N-acetyltransferase [Alkalicoccobacillus plakortidis]
MFIENKNYSYKGIQFTIRSAIKSDAERLSEVRYIIDGETENMDRVQGENYLSTSDFISIIKIDEQSAHNLFLVALIDDQIVGFSRCEGISLARFAHKVEFGLAVLQDYWGFSIGYNLLKESVHWADSANIKKITLNVTENNVNAIKLYKKFNFIEEGLLRHEKLLADGVYHHTVLMGRINNVHK